MPWLLVSPGHQQLHDFDYVKQIFLFSMILNSLCGFSAQGPFYYHRLTFSPAWISNHMPRKVWDEITNPFLNFNSLSLGMDK